MRPSCLTTVKVASLLFLFNTLQAQTSQTAINPKMYSQKVQNNPEIFIGQTSYEKEIPECNKIANAYESLPNTSSGKSLANSINNGTINKIVVFVRFSDEDEYGDSIKVYEKIFNDSLENATSLYAYYKECSYGKLLIKTNFPIPAENSKVQSFRDINPRKYYMVKSPSNPNGYLKNFDSAAVRQNELVNRVLNYVKDLVPDSINLDYNNDNIIDDISLILTGDVDLEGGPAYGIIWPATYNFYDFSGIKLLINNKKVENIALTTQNRTLSNGSSDICHETFHMLGSPDLYHYNWDRKEIVGEWDLMGLHNLPQHTSAYMKFRYGKWIDSIPKITSNGTYSLKPLVSDKNNCYQIVSPYSTKEYFVLEYRKKLGMFESRLPGSGLLVYRVNSMYDGKGNELSSGSELYLFRPNGSTSSDGVISEANLNGLRNSINDTTVTRCYLSNGNPGGLDIRNIREAGDSILFDVICETTAFPVYKEVSSDSCTTLFSLTSNTKWTATSNQDWCIIAPTRGSGDRKISASCSANTTQSQRIAIISISVAGVNTQTITITQAIPNGIQPGPFSNLRIYPNPFKNEITIEGIKSIKELLITNLLGQTMIYSFGQNDKMTIDTDKLLTGSYFLTLTSNNGEKITRLLIKE